MSGFDYESEGGKAGHLVVKEVVTADDAAALVEQLRACGRRIPKEGFTMSIPARPDYDADLLLMRAADVIQALLGEVSRNHLTSAKGEGD
jgi:hypothetical protein